MANCEVATPGTDIDVERVARALADPSRFEILELVANYPGIPCTDIVDRVPLRQPTVSHHLKELTLAGLIEPRRDGAYVRYSVRPDTLNTYVSRLQMRLGGLSRRAGALR